MPAGWVAAAAVVYSAYSASETADENLASSEQAQADSAALSEDRFTYAKDLLNPYIEQSDKAKQQLMVEMGLAEGEAGTAYMDTPGYKTAMEERLDAVGQQQANLGQAYSGRRMREAASAGSSVQSQFYGNYMNLLSGMASPNVAQNLASLGMGQAATLGQENYQYMQDQNEIRSQQTADTNAAVSDLAGGYANYQSQQPQQQSSTNVSNQGIRGDYLSDA